MDVGRGREEKVGEGPTSKGREVLEGKVGEMGRKGGGERVEGGRSASRGGGLTPLSSSIITMALSFTSSEINPILVENHDFFIPPCIRRPC